MPGDVTFQRTWANSQFAPIDHRETVSEAPPCCRGEVHAETDACQSAESGLLMGGEDPPVRGEGASASCCEVVYVFCANRRQG